MIGLECHRRFRGRYTETAFRQRAYAAKYLGHNYRADCWAGGKGGVARNAPDSSASKPVVAALTLWD